MADSPPLVLCQGTKGTALVSLPKEEQERFLLAGMERSTKKTLARACFEKPSALIFFGKQSDWTP